MKKELVQYILLTMNPNVRGIRRIIDSISPETVIVVDNTPGETSGFRDYHFPSHVVYLPQYKNLGYDGGVNIGLTYCMNHDAEWMVILNDDIKISSQDMQKATKELLQYPPGIAGPKIGTLDPVRFSSVLTEKNSDVTDPYSYVSGVFLAIHREVIQKIGMMYEPYFIYFEDCDYSIRAKKADFPIYELRLRTFYHHESQSIKQKSFLKEYYHARNHLLFVTRHASIHVQFHEVLRMPKTLYEHWQRRNIGAITGIKDFALRRFGTYREQ